MILSGTAITSSAVLSSGFSWNREDAFRVLTRSTSQRSLFEVSELYAYLHTPAQTLARVVGLAFCVEVKFDFAMCVIIDNQKALLLQGLSIRERLKIDATRNQVAGFPPAKRCGAAVLNGNPHSACGSDVHSHRKPARDVDPPHEQARA